LRTLTPAEPGLLPWVTGFSGLAFRRGKTTFTLADLINELGISVSGGGPGWLHRVRAGSPVPARRRPGRQDAAGTGGCVVTFRHAAIHAEPLAA
jgi:hypothetical protein